MDDDLPDTAPASAATAPEGIVTDDACRMFAKACFQHYTKPFCDCAMITEGEFCNSVEEFTRYFHPGLEHASTLDRLGRMTTRFG